MYAVVMTGGKQYKVSQGDILRVEKLEVPVGGTIELDQVRLVAKDDGVVVDAQALASAKVVAQVTGQGRRKKRGGQRQHPESDIRHHAPEPNQTRGMFKAQLRP